MAERWTNIINVVRASILARRGMSYRDIGILLAKEEGRSNSYTAGAVYNAVRKYRRGEREP